MTELPVKRIDPALVKLGDIVVRIITSDQVQGVPAGWTLIDVVPNVIWKTCTQVSEVRMDDFVYTIDWESAQPDWMEFPPHQITFPQ